MTHVVGIDLGTTTSAIAIMKDGQPTIITTSEGRHIPSVVAFNRNGERLIGQAAKRQAALNPENTIFSIKRFLGRHCDEPEIQVERNYVAHQLVAGAHDDLQIHVPHAQRQFPPQEIASSILRKLRQEAEAYLGEPVKQAVLAVPGYFNDGQRQAVEEAGRFAGFETVRLVNEPAAAALAYLQHETSETILVVDLGGGAYNVSVLEVGNERLTVKATSGDLFLGGNSWDAMIAAWLIDGFLRQYGIDLRKDQQAVQRIREAAERAKIELSSSEQTTIYLPFLISDSSGPKHLRTILTRSRFKELVTPLLERLAEPLHKALGEADVELSDLDAVVLVGGASRMPYVQEKLLELTGHKPTVSLAPQEAVVLGAALHAAMLADELQEAPLHDVTPLSLGIETMGGLMTVIIPRNTPIPTRRTEIYSTIEDEQTAVDIAICQGERQMATDNTKLGVVHLDGIPVAPRGVPQIEVTFEIDASGMLHVSVRSIATGNSRTLSIASGARLPDGEVERMLGEAEHYAAEDQKRRNLIEARNVAQQIIYQTERSLEHLNGHISGPECREKKKEIIGQIAALRGALLGRNTMEIRQLTNTLEQANVALSQIAYGPGPFIWMKRRGHKDGSKSGDATDISIESL